MERYMVGRPLCRREGRGVDGVQIQIVGGGKIVFPVVSAVIPLRL